MKKIIRKIKIWKFNKDFDRYYNGLLMGGDLYDAKVKLLSDMKNNKALYLENYLTKGVSISNQLTSRISFIQSYITNKTPQP